jgi:tetratricopeptide (TPR) repeat protein
MQKFVGQIRLTASRRGASVLLARRRLRLAVKRRSKSREFAFERLGWLNIRGNILDTGLLYCFCSYLPSLEPRSSTVGTEKKIEQAIELRREDQLSRADTILSQCLSLPGHRAAIQLEWQLGTVQQGDLRDEHSLQKKAELRTDQSWRILESLCKGNMAVFRWNEARGYAEEMLERRPDDPGALWLRGKCWVKLQLEARAIDDFRQAVRLSPTTWEYKLSLAELLQLQGYNAEATSLYRELIQEKQYDARILIGLSRCLHDAANLEEAKRVLDFLIELKPESYIALIEMSRLSLRQGDPVRAEEWARNAASIAPRNQQVQFVLSLCLKALGKKDTDLEQRVHEDDRIRVELKNILRESSSNPAALCRVGQFMLATGEVEEGIGCYFRAIIEDPKNKAAHEALADYFLNNGQPHRSLQHRRDAGGDLDRVKSELAQPLLASAPSIDFQSSGRPTELLEATKEQVHQLCAACHAYPPPDSFPKSAWRKEVQLGFDFLRDSTLSGKFPSIESVVQYYEHRAPNQLEATTTKTATTPSSFHFEVAGGGWLKNTQPFPATTHVSFVQLKPKKNMDLLVCDARVDQVLLLDTEKNPPRWSVLGPALVPSHAEVVDLDGDGNKDIIVASLGQFFPTDDKVGSVVWLRATSGENYSPMTLLDGVGRVADVRPADFNRDGLIDLVVAVFGWRKGGEILYLENKTTDWREPVFERRQIVGVREPIKHWRLRLAVNRVLPTSTSVRYLFSH